MAICNIDSVHTIKPGTQPVDNGLIRDNPERVPDTIIRLEVVFRRGRSHGFNELIDLRL